MIAEDWHVAKVPPSSPGARWSDRIALRIADYHLVVVIEMAWHLAERRTHRRVRLALRLADYHRVSDPVHTSVHT